MEKSRKAFIGFVDEAIAAASSMRHDELLFFYKGIPYPSTGCSPETFKALESFEARRDDVILAGYLKCGTNWLSQISTDLIAISQKKTPGSESSVNAEEEEVFPYLEVGDAEKYDVGTEKRMSKLPSPRFMVTHLRHENLPKSIFQSNAKILLLIRNPKDVATSYYHFSNGLATLPSYETWDDFYTDFMTKKMAWGCYFEYLSEWNKCADKENIMTVTYEEVKEEGSSYLLQNNMQKRNTMAHPSPSDLYEYPMYEASRKIQGSVNTLESRVICSKVMPNFTFLFPESCPGCEKHSQTFFGIPLNEEQLQLVVERSSFQSMKKNSDKTHGSLGNILFRKGGVSDWKNLFTEDQSKKMDKAFEEHIAGTKLGKKLKYDLYCKA